MMNPWRDAAEEAGVGFYLDAGVFGTSYDWPPFYSDAARSAFRAGRAWIRSALLPPVPPSRLDVALAALKRAERNGFSTYEDPTCPLCGGFPVYHNSHHAGSRRVVTVKYAIKHAPDCSLAHALYGDWP